MGQLTNIFITSGVNEKGEGFLNIAAHGDDGTLLIGQMTPEECRAHALGYLEAAEGADQDAAVLRVLRRLELPDQLAAMVVTELRNDREGKG